MSKRTAGIAFFAMAAFIFSMRHIGAALFAGLIEQSEWPSNVYTLPVGLGIANIVLGVIYLVWGELEELGLIPERVKKSDEPTPLLAEVDVEEQAEEDEPEALEEMDPSEEEDEIPEEERAEGEEDAVEEEQMEEEDAPAEEDEASEEVRAEDEEDAVGDEEEVEAAEEEDEEETSDEERAR